MKRNALIDVLILILISVQIIGMLLNHGYKVTKLISFSLILSRSCANYDLKIYPPKIVNYYKHKRFTTVCHGH